MITPLSPDRRDVEALSQRVIVAKKKMRRENILEVFLDSVAGWSRNGEEYSEWGFI